MANVDALEIKRLAEEKINEAREMITSESPNGVDVSRLQAELTAILVNVGSIRSRYESHANEWRTMYGSIVEMVRSLRRLIDSVNTERMSGG